MTKLEQLEQLAAAIEAGEDRSDWMPWIDPMDRTRGILPYKFANLPAAYNGSLDAAKALHDAVLPGWFPGLSQNIHDGRWFAWVQTKETHSTAYSDNPARAWLLAIVRALIEKEKME